MIYYMGKITIPQLIEDIRRAEKAGAYFSALSLSFALVSECANVKYPDEWFTENAQNDEYLIEHFPQYYKSGKYSNKNHDRERFTMWFDDWSNAHGSSEANKSQMEEFARQEEEFRKSPNGIMPRVNGELLYQIRCCLLHEGSDDIEFHNNKKILDEGNKNITAFDFVVTEYKELYPAGGESCCVGSSGNASISVDVQGLINTILHFVQLYYDRDMKNEHNAFNTISITDTTKRYIGV